MTVCQENLHHAQKFQKQAYNKGVKHKTYASGDKVKSNSEYIKIKHNWNLKAKFFALFRVLHPVSKQAYKLKLQIGKECMMFSTYYYWNKTLLGRDG